MVARRLPPLFFGLFAPYAPPPPTDAEPPTLWGDEAHLRTLFGDRITSLALTPHELVERHAGAPADYWAFYRQTFGPVVALRRQLASDPERLAAFDRDCLQFVTRANSGSATGPSEYRYGCGVVIARRA